MATKIRKKGKKSELSELSHADKNILIGMMQEQILLLKEKNKRLERRLKDLESKLKKNSSNSSKPPSSDLSKKKKPPKTTSSKKKTGKKPGGQPGHKGTTLELSKNPDEVIVFGIDRCDHCKANLSKVKPSLEHRQKYEIPEPKMFITEYVCESKECKCGYTTSALFPEGITHKVQYGKRAKSLMVYLNQYQLIPYSRSEEFFKTIYNQKISSGTISNAVKELSKRCSTVDQEIKLLLSKQEVANTDETSMRVDTDKYWLHTVGTEELTHYAIHKKRGSDATMEIGILPEFSGVLVHDHWKSYYKYQDCSHALCNAHHLRELRFFYEQHDLKWAKEMSDLLIKINDHKLFHISEGKDFFCDSILKKYESAYVSLTKKAKKEHAHNVTRDSSNLLKRFIEYKEEVLLFMYDFDVPFTNNLSERDIRMSKVKQKISGCFRSVLGAIDYCKIHTLLSTSKKNAKNIFKIIQKAMEKELVLDDLLVPT